jgi:hypothetical protein
MNIYDCFDREICMPDLKKIIVCSYGFVMSSIALLCITQVFALEPKPEAEVAKWSGDDWGIVKILPRIVKYGGKVHIHGMVVGSSASDPFWSCSQYNGWNANGTSAIIIKVPGEWEMVSTGHDIFGNNVNEMRKDGGDLPPYGWENRISDTCYCEVTDFGATGGCKSREIQPDLFRMMDQMNPREGNVQFATVMSGKGWTRVSAIFGGYVGVGWSDAAADYVYVVSDDSLLEEDADNDGLSDAWEYAHSPNQSLDDFAGGSSLTGTGIQVLAEEDWVNPYAPSEPGWVSAGPNDWDGDGISNKEEYLKWKGNKRDGNDWPYDPTFINVIAGCPASAVLREQGRDAELNTLRRFRDEVLSCSSTGQEIIKLYYAWGPAIVEAMEEDEAFKNEVKAALDQVLALLVDASR